MAAENPGRSFRNLVLVGVGCFSFFLGFFCFVVFIVLWATVGHHTVSIR